MPVGLDRTAVVLGKDINGDVLYRGEQSGITVTAGETADAGTIVVELFNPALNPPVLISPTNEETVKSGSFSFQWNPVYGASENQIQVSTDTNFTSTVIDETVTTTYHTPTTTLSAGTYYWRLRTEDSYGNQSAWSEVRSFIVATEPGVAPSAPIGVTPTTGDGEVTISWDRVTDATSYNIYWSTSQGVTKDTGTKISTFSSPYTHTGLTNGTTYYYVVTAENDYGESDESDEVSATPSATGSAPSTPTTVSATPGDGEVAISWDSVSDATSYTIYMHTSSGVSKTSFTEKRTVTTTSHTWTALTNDTTYYYVVTAKNDYGESDESDEVSATPAAAGTAPSTPTTVSATPGDGEVAISWDSVSDATSYTIYMHTSSGVSKTSFTEKRTVTTTAYTWTSLSNGTAYYYVVTAKNDYGESGESDEVSATLGEWVRLLGTSSRDDGYGIAVDSNGNIYVTGFTEGDLHGNTNAGKADIFVSKYDTYGTRQWTELLGTSVTDHGYGIAVDSNGNIYATGHTEADLDGNTNAGSWDIFVSKYDTYGTRQWTELLGTSAQERGQGIAVDSNGNIYVTGFTEGDLDGKTNAGGKDIFVSKYDTNGTRQWTQLLGTSSHDNGYGIVVDSNGNIYVTGGTNGDLDGNTNAGLADIFVSKYDTNGTRQWTELLGTSSDHDGYGIAVDSNGNIYVTGFTEGDLHGNTNAGNQDIFVSKYDTTGTRQWTKLLGTSSWDDGTGIAVDSNGNIYVTGHTKGDLDGNTNAGDFDIFIWKLVDIGM